MNLRSGYPFSLIKKGLPFDYPKLAAPLKSDIIIMGGGISGALTAYHLIEAGINCAVIDGRTIGLGSSCASTGLLQYEIDTPLCELKNKVGLTNAVLAYKLCATSILSIADIAQKINFTDFSFKPSLYYAAYKKDVSLLKEEYSIRKKCGFDVTYLKGPDINKQFNFKSPAAILSSEGGQINAYTFTHALFQHCIKKGLKVFDRTFIKKINHQKNAVILTTENDIVLKAKKLIYATGYETIKYVDKKIVSLHSTYACISEQMNSSTNFWKDDALIWNTANPYLYMRITSDNRILIGGRDEQFYNTAKNDSLLKRKTQQLTKDFSKIFPDIHFKPEFSWTGTFGTTHDSLPFIGHYKKLPNSLFALGFGGNGITFSLIAAEILRDIITSKKSNNYHLFSFDRK